MSNIYRGPNEIDVVLKFFDLVMKIQDFILQKQNKVAII
jgi:hypothetical protein